MLQNQNIRKLIGDITRPINQLSAFADDFIYLRSRHTLPRNIKLIYITLGRNQHALTIVLTLVLIPAYRLSRSSTIPLCPPSSISISSPIPRKIFVNTRMSKKIKSYQYKFNVVYCKGHTLVGSLMITHRPFQLTKKKI